MHLVLASGSPRRAALLEAAGIPFTPVAVDVDETPRPAELPEPYVLRLAREKAREGFRRIPGSLVLGADTTVLVGEEMLGKPDDSSHAREMLRKLAGRSHVVLTGVALVEEGRESTGIAQTRVQFLPLDDDEIAWYAGTGEPIGKAGGYAIQGFASRYVDAIEGSYTNVVGLPVSLVYRLLTQAGHM